MLFKGKEAQIKQQIITLMEIILSQNYFKFQNKIHQPEKGLTMGSPIPSTIAEIFLQHLEDIHIKSFSLKKTYLSTQDM
jgi:hypothetical protein